MSGQPMSAEELDYLLWQHEISIGELGRLVRIRPGRLFRMQTAQEHIPVPIAERIRDALLERESDGLP